MDDAREVIDRREAVRRAVLLVGGSLAAPAALAALVKSAEAQASGSAWAPRTLTREQLERVATIAERIIPTTDTPGARAAGVHRFIDTMLTEYYTSAERQRFLAGLTALDARAHREFGQPFLRATAAQQVALLERADREVLQARQATAATAASKETERGGGGIVASGQPDADPSTSDLSSFFRTMKEWTVLGYYTSQLGATKELRYVRVPGKFEGCVPLAKIGRSWAS
jgi:gluconate 2-dehydrogenase gamma chain